MHHSVEGSQLKARRSGLCNPINHSLVKFSLCMRAQWEQFPDRDSAWAIGSRHICRVDRWVCWSWRHGSGRGTPTSATAIIAAYVEIFYLIIIKHLLWICELLESRRCVWFAHHLFPFLRVPVTWEIILVEGEKEAYVTSRLNFRASDKFEVEFIFDLSFLVVCPWASDFIL